MSNLCLSGWTTPWQEERRLYSGELNLWVCVGTSAVLGSTLYRARASLTSQSGAAVTITLE